MKQIILLLSLLTASVISMRSATPEDVQNAIAIYQKDGKVAKFSFTEKPVITYSGNELVLTTTKTTVQYPVALLQKIAVDVSDELFTDVKEVQSEAQFCFQGGTLSISGGEPGSAVFIYDISGIEVGQYKLDSKGCATLSLQHLESKLYIVKTTRFTFKFRKS